MFLTCGKREYKVNMKDCPLFTKFHKKNKMELIKLVKDVPKVSLLVTNVPHSS